MSIRNTAKKPYRLEIGGTAQRPSNYPPLRLVHANDQDSGDDFEGRRNWTVMLILFAVFGGVFSFIVSAVV